MVEERILKDIREGKLRPKPKWVFLAREWSLWSILALALGASASALSAVFFLLIKNDWRLYEYLDVPFFNFVWESIPAPWLTVFLILTATAAFVFRLTRGNYQKAFLSVVAGIVLVTLLASIIVYKADIAESVERFASFIPHYDTYITSKRSLWSNPAVGLLSGTIEKPASENVFTLRDWKERLWTIQAEHLFNADNVNIDSGTPVKLIGRRKGPNLFEAVEARSW